MRCEAFLYVTTSQKPQDDYLFLLLMLRFRQHILILTTDSILLNVESAISFLSAFNKGFKSFDVFLLC